MKLGIDIDGTITHAPAFFRLLTAALYGRPGVKVHVVTARGGSLCHEREGVEFNTAAELRGLGIRYDVLACLGPRQKVAYIIEHELDVIFDDTDEEVLAAPESCTVFKVREAMNFCWESGRWLHSYRTSVRLADERSVARADEPAGVEAGEPAAGGACRLEERLGGQVVEAVAVNENVRTAGRRVDLSDGPGNRPSGPKQAPKYIT